LLRFGAVVSGAKLVRSVAIRRDGGRASLAEGASVIAQSDASIKTFGCEVDQLLACGKLQLDLGKRPAERRDQRLQQDRHHRAWYGETQAPDRSLSEFARGPACGDEFLEGGPCARKKSFAGFGQARRRGSCG